jgi:hypothetical protein
MKPDLYTKIVLTVIALALLVICTENVVNPRTAQAQAKPVSVVISDIDLTARMKLVTGGPPLRVALVGGTKYPMLEVDGTNPLPVKAQ